MEIGAILAPSNLGLGPPMPGHEPGAWRMASALASLGLLTELGIEHVVELPRPTYRFDRDPDSGVRNVEEIVDFSGILAGAVEETVRSGLFPLVVGGDCSILLGSLMGLQRCGEHGLIFVDGHRDYLTPATTRSGGVAGMDLAIATGVGVEPLVSLGGSSPLVAPSATAALGFRDNGDVVDLSAAIHETPASLWDVDAVRELGPELAERVLRTLPSEELDGFWLHVDVDVLSTEEMPAVDSPQAGGLSFGELEDLIGQFIRTGRTAGLQVTIYDPELDRDGTAGRRLVTCLRDGLLTAQSNSSLTVGPPPKRRAGH